MLLRFPSSVKWMPFFPREAVEFPLEQLIELPMKVDRRRVFRRRHTPHGVGVPSMHGEVVADQTHCSTGSGIRAGLWALCAHRSAVRRQTSFEAVTKLMPNPTAAPATTAIGQGSPALKQATEASQFAPAPSAWQAA